MSLPSYPRPSPTRNVPVRRAAFAGLSAGLCLLAACAPGEPSGAEDVRVSEFGRYEGYSEAAYDSWVNTSRYVEMSDGVRLAVDVTFPAVGGERAEGPFPMVWTHSRYHRNPGALARLSDPEDTTEIRSMVDVQPDLQRLVRHGYVVASVQVRGGGASFGTYEGLFSERETDDAREMVDWFASRPWSDGNVGMFGGSYLGMTQYMAASEGHPALKAIFPNVAGLDMYETIHPGGVYRDDLIDHWGALTKSLDSEWLSSPVDADPDSSLLRAAVAEHADNWDVGVEYAAGRHRDHDVPTLAWLEHGPAGVLEELRAAAVPAYHWNGWYDIFVTDATLLWANYLGPQKLGIGPWSHAGVPDSTIMAERARLTAVEQHRWFDYWLKGIDNGIMDEPPVHYAVMEEPGRWRWASASDWPVDGTEERSLFFADGPSGSVASVNDGRLAPRAPQVDVDFDAYTVDPTTTTGTTTRWDNAVGAAPVMVYPDMTANDEKALTFTSGPLEEDLTVVGHPVVTLWMTSSSGDGIVQVLLEEVDETGVSRYVTEGVVRASHRALADAPWDNLGLPFHRSFEEDVAPIPADGPVELTQDLHPTAAVFDAGHRIRVTVTGADADNLEAPGGTPTYRVYFGEEHPSAIVLPVRGR